MNRSEVNQINTDLQLLCQGMEETTVGLRHSKKLVLDGLELADLADRAIDVIALVKKYRSLKQAEK